MSAPPVRLRSVRYVRTPDGILIRLQQLPGDAWISGLAVNSGSAAWAMPEIIGPRHTIRSRVYLARVSDFHPSIIAAPSCSTAISGPYLSAHWLAWAEQHLTPFERHDTFTIHAMSLASNRMVSWTYHYNATTFPPSMALSGDTLVWTQEWWQGAGIRRALVFGVFTRTLPDGATRTVQIVHEHIGKFFPSSYVQRFFAPQIAGRFVVWERSRIQNGRPRDDVLAATLPYGPVRVIAWNGAEEPVTNGWKVAWLRDHGDSLDLVQLDMHTGKRTVVGHNIFPVFGSPQLSGTTLSWQSATRGRPSRYLFVRDLLTGRRYTLLHWTARSVAGVAPVRAVGPGRVESNQVAWQEIIRSGPKTTAYLAIATVPRDEGNCMARVDR